MYFKAFIIIRNPTAAKKAVEKIRDHTLIDKLNSTQGIIGNEIKTIMKAKVAENSVECSLNRTSLFIIAAKDDKKAAPRAKINQFIPKN